jgi:hypothetical protein
LGTAALYPKYRRSKWAEYAAGIREHFVLKPTGRYHSERNIILQFQVRKIC